MSHDEAISDLSFNEIWDLITEDQRRQIAMDFIDDNHSVLTDLVSNIPHTANGAFEEEFRQNWQEYRDLALETLRSNGQID